MLALAGDGADRRPDGRILRILRPDKTGDLRVVILHGDIRLVKVRIHDPERHLSRTGIVERIAGAALRIGVLCIGNRLGQVDDLQVGGSVHFVARCVPGLNGDVMGALAGERDRRGGGFPVGVDQPVDLEFLAVLHNLGKNIAVFLRQPLVIHQLEQNVGRRVAVVVAGLSGFPDCRGIFRGKRGRRFLQDDLVALLIFGAVARLVDGDEVQGALYLGLEGEFRRVDAGFFIVCDLRDLLARAADHAAAVIYKPVFEFLHTGGGILGGEGEFDACIVPAEGKEFQNCFAGDLADIVGEVGGRDPVDLDLGVVNRVRDFRLAAVHAAQIYFPGFAHAFLCKDRQGLRPGFARQAVAGRNLPALRRGDGDGAGKPAAVVLRVAQHCIGRGGCLRVGDPEVVILGDLLVFLIRGAGDRNDKQPGRMVIQRNGQLAAEEDRLRQSVRQLRRQAAAAAVKLDGILRAAVDQLRRFFLGGFLGEGQKGIVHRALDREDIGRGAFLVQVGLRRAGLDRDLAGAQDGQRAVRSDRRNVCRFVAVQLLLLCDRIDDLAVFRIRDRLAIGLRGFLRIKRDLWRPVRKLNAYGRAFHRENIAALRRGKDAVIRRAGRDLDFARHIEGDFITDDFCFRRGVAVTFDVLGSELRRALNAGLYQRGFLTGHIIGCADAAGVFESALQTRGIGHMDCDRLLICSVACPVKLPGEGLFAKRFGAFRVPCEEGFDR